MNNYNYYPKKSDSYQHVVFTILLFFIAINILILDIKVFSSENFQVSEITTATTTSSAVAVPEVAPSSSVPCSSSCTRYIDQTLKQQLTQIPVSPSILIPAKTATLKEYYIPLGSGDTQNNAWEDITTTDTLIDTANYDGIKEVYFIATLKNPTQNGRVEAQLYNVTDKHVVYGSTLTLDGPLSQTLTSSKITLDTGGKLYRVQLRSGLSAPSSVDTAKIRILAQ